MEICSYFQGPPADRGVPPSLKISPEKPFLLLTLLKEFTYVSYHSQNYFVIIAASFNSISVGYFYIIRDWNVIATADII